jgi:multidrug efflux pump subunit AcrB
MKFLIDKITRLSLKFRAVTLILVCILMGLGVVAWTRLNQELLPPIEIPQTLILTQTSGLTADQVLKIVTEPLEARLGQIDEIINIQTQTQSTIGSIAIAFNDFGLDQVALQDDIRRAAEEIWLPLRSLETDQPASYIHQLDAEVLLFLAEADSNFLFQLSPEFWTTISDEALIQVLAYMASQQEETISTTNALQGLVDKEIAPQLLAIKEVVSVEIAGGQSLPDETGAVVEVVEPTTTEASSILLRISPEVWQIITSRVDELTTLDQSAVDYLSGISFSVPSQITPPELPETWHTNADGSLTYFTHSTDLLEIVGFNNPVANILNTFLETGKLKGALGQTNDLTVEVVENMLALDPSMGAYFTAEQILVLPEDVFAYLTSRDDFINNLDGFTRDAIAARVMASSISDIDPASITHTPVDLPSAWRIQPPQLITFSFSDLPLATFSVFGSTTDQSIEEVPAVIETDTEETPETIVETGTETVEEATTDEEAVTVEVPDAPLPMIFGQLSNFLGVEVANTSDILSLNIPEEAQFFFGKDHLSAAEFLNILVSPPDFSEIPADAIPEAFANFSPDLITQFAPLLIGGLTADNIAYLVANDPDFVADLSPEASALLSASASAVLTGEAGETTVSASQTAPALNPEWSELGSLVEGFIGAPIQLETADDLLNPAFPLSALLPELLNIPNSADMLQELFANFPVDASAYIVEKAPQFFEAFPTEFLVFFPQDVRATWSDELQAKAPGALLPNSWEALFTQTSTLNRSFFTTDDIYALDSSASVVLNRLNNAPVSESLNSYSVRLIDSLTPEILAVFTAKEPNFYEELDPEVLLKFNSEALNTLTVEEINSLSNITPEQAEQLLNIRANPEESAFAQLAALYTTDIPEADPSAPDLNAGWQTLGNFYNIELDSADDFFRFPEGFPFASGAEMIDSLFGNPQGESILPLWLSEFPADAVAYIHNRDETFFQILSSRALSYMPEEALAVLPEEIQLRALESATVFRPQSQITRTNGSDSLFLTIYKTSDANTVSTFAEVKKLMDNINSNNQDVQISVLFEQSSFIEHSIEGVAREGGLGAVFAIIVILVFLSGGSWNRNRRRIVGTVLTGIFLVSLIALVGTSLNAADGDWVQAWHQSDVVFRILLGFGVLAGLAVLLWPGNLPDPAWRATLVIAVSIPLSIMPALVAMYWGAPVVHDLLDPLAKQNGFFHFLQQLFPSDLTLNIMTLSGLTVAVGRVIDDSIVVLENIFRQLQGSSGLLAGVTSVEERRRIKRETIVQGTRDVSSAIFIATLIAATVFLPLGLTGGLIGAFFLPFGLAVTYALAGSFVVAVTVVPVLTYLFINVEDIPEEKDIWLADYYRPVLKWALSSNLNKGIVILISFLSIGVALVLFAQRPFAFLPNFGEPQIVVEALLPSGTSILETNGLVEELENWIIDNIDDGSISIIQTNVGGGTNSLESMFTGTGVNESQAALTLGISAGVTQSRLNEITKAIEVEAKYIFNTCPTSDAPSNSAEQRALMEIGNVDGLIDVVCRDGSPINNYVTASAASLVDSGLGGFSLVVSGPMNAEVNQSIINAINSVDGINRATSNFADTGDNGMYIRVNQTEAFSYTAELNTQNTIGVTQQAIQAIKDLPEIANNICPEKTTDNSNCFIVSQGFESEIQTEGFQSISYAIVLAIILVIIILIITMQSFVYWLAIVFSIMVAPIGAAIALTISNHVLGISAMMGLLMLIGMVIANGVVLIDRVRSNIHERNMPLNDALIEAGGRRLRPILMTSITSLIALFPLAIGLSDGAIIAAELGTVVIGGLISSTILTLIAVPVVYSLLTPLHNKLAFRKDQ